MYFGVAEGDSGQPGLYLNDNCSAPVLVTSDGKFSFSFMIERNPGKVYYFRPFLVPEVHLQNNDNLLQRLGTCIRYGERKEFLDMSVDLSNFKQTKCVKDGNNYLAQFTIDGSIPGVFGDLSNWGFDVKTKTGSWNRCQAKTSSDYYPPTTNSFTCEIEVGESDITTINNERVANITITPFITYWNRLPSIDYFENVNYTLIIKDDGLLSCPDANHPHWIDLGLPSGTQWRCCNEGASSPEAYGGYYTFGQVSTAPTLDQIKELLDNTTSVWTQLNGVNGRKFTGSNGGIIFLPAAGRVWDGKLSGVGTGGRYWSSTPNDEYNAYGLDFYSSYANWYRYNSRRYDGRSVRPVR